MRRRIPLDVSHCEAVEFLIAQPVQARRKVIAQHVQQTRLVSIVVDRQSRADIQCRATDQALAQRRIRVGVFFEQKRFKRQLPVFQEHGCLRARTLFPS
ncbi:hypothetical protein D3C81_1959810 [compost metagenome]